MDLYDRKNLQFILSCSEDVLEDWWETISKDDQDYALELIRTYRQEMNVKKRLMKSLDKTVKTFPDAQNVLKKFTLN